MEPEKNGGRRPEREPSTRTLLGIGLFRIVRDSFQISGHGCLFPGHVGSDRRPREAEHADISASWLCSPRLAFPLLRSAKPGGVAPEVRGVARPGQEKIIYETKYNASKGRLHIGGNYDRGGHHWLAGRDRNSELCESTHGQPKECLHRKSESNGRRESDLGFGAEKDLY